MATKRSSIFGFFDSNSQPAGAVAVMYNPDTAEMDRQHRSLAEIQARRDGLMRSSWPGLGSHRFPSPPLSSSDVMSLGGQVRAYNVPDKPSTDMLHRLAAPQPLARGADGDIDSRTALAVEVEDLLGYTPLRADVGAPSKLRRLLAELEIEPFDPSTVEAYQMKMQAHFQADADQRLYMEFGGRADFPYYRTAVSWDMVPLRSYSKPVPEFVLRKAVAIQKHAAAAGETAQFFVHELRERQVTLDPFLVVALGEPGSYPVGASIAAIAAIGDIAHIEVWDEPEFEKAL